MFTYIYTYIHIYICLCIYIYKCVYIYVYTYIHIYMHTYIYIYLYIYIYIFIHTYIYVYVQIYIYVYLYVFLHIYTFTSIHQLSKYPSMICTFVYLLAPERNWNVSIRQALWHSSTGVAPRARSLSHSVSLTRTYPSIQGVNSPGQAAEGAKKSGCCSGS